MRGGDLRPFVFYPAVGLCVWPALVNVSAVVTYVQMAAGAGRLLSIPPVVVTLAAAQAALTLWAVVAAVVMFRKRQDSYAWLVVLLALFPMISLQAGRYLL